MRICCVLLNAEWFVHRGSCQNKLQERKRNEGTPFSLEVLCLKVLKYTRGG